MLRISVLFACLLLCCANGSARAAEVYCAGYFGNFTKDQAKPRWPSGRMPIANVTCANGYLTGQISKGDYEKVESLIKSNEPFFYSFSINSAGGDVNEAMKIGRLFRKKLISTTAPSDGQLYYPADTEFNRFLCQGLECYCASACALIWLGGVDRIGKVGLHRPWTNDPAFRRLAAGDASTEYQQILGPIVEYLKEMEVPQSIIDLMVATSSHDIQWVDWSDAGLERPPSIAEWEDASCGPVLGLEHYLCSSRILDNSRDRQLGFNWRSLF